ncbi:MAG: hypothetical protein WC069_01800 [Candidatus Shapirobacteria bacterium]
MIKPKISIRIYKDSKMVKSIASRKVRRIYHFLKADKFQNCCFELRVNYEFGFNEGIYFTKEDLLQVIPDFLDADC